MDILSGNGSGHGNLCTGLKCTGSKKKKRNKNKKADRAGQELPPVSPLSFGKGNTREMLSVQNGTTENVSAKRSARRGKLWIFPVVLLLCVLAAALGGFLIYRLYTPSEYTESEVNEYVKSIYGDSWKLQKKTPLSDEKGEGIRYLYASGDGGSFSVFSISVPVYEKGEATGRWEKALSDNYFSTVIEKNMDALKKIEKKCKKNPEIRLEIEKTGDDSGIYGASYTFRMYLETNTCFEEAAGILKKMDKLFSFSCGAGTPPYDQMRKENPSVGVYLKPEKSGPAADVISSSAPIVQKGDSGRIPNLSADWSATGEREKYRISTISFTDATSSSRLKTEDVFIRLENDYVDAAKTFGKTCYAAPAELKDKYPAPILALVNVGGHKLKVSDADSASYKFYYHRGTGTYWLAGLDVCEDFDGNPFGDYSGRGSFAKLIDYLGGSYSCDKWKSGWRIGNNQWTAEAETEKTGKSPYTYKGMTLFRNGNNENLDPIPKIFEGTGALPSGRPYSIRDLIRMLDVRITINQKDMTAVMFRNF